jgi:hypothetical protein
MGELLTGGLRQPFLEPCDSFDPDRPRLRRADRNDVIGMISSH